MTKIPKAKPYSKLDRNLHYKFMKHLNYRYMKDKIVCN